MTANEMLESIISTLEARAMGHNLGGDIRVMAAVDSIVAREREVSVAPGRGQSPINTECTVCTYAIPRDKG